MFYWNKKYLNNLFLFFNLRVGTKLKVYVKNEYNVTNLDFHFYHASNLDKC